MKKTTLVMSIIIGAVLIGSIIVTKKPTSMAPVVNHRTYSLTSDASSKMYIVNSPNAYSFSITDEEGVTLKDFAVTHTKLMHVIVVRKDLEYFQHIHPTYDNVSGMFTLKDLTFPTDGPYRIFADFAPASNQKNSMGMPPVLTLSEDLTVGNSTEYSPQPFGVEETTKTFDDYTVTLTTHGTLTSGQENMLMFSLSQNGQPVTHIEPYLGALGHSVILRENTLDFIHAHPIEELNSKQTGSVDFMVDFPLAGKYKVFTQFQIQGKIITTDFVVSVSVGTDKNVNISGMDHSMH